MKTSLAFSVISVKMAKGTKRASPGAEDEKNPLQDAELGEEDAKKLEEIAKFQARAELAIGAYHCPYAV